MARVPSPPPPRGGAPGGEGLGAAIGVEGVEVLEGHHRGLRHPPVRLPPRRVARRPHRTGGRGGPRAAGWPQRLAGASHSPGVAAARVMGPYPFTILWWGVAGEPTLARCEPAARRPCAGEGREVLVWTEYPGETAPEDEEAAEGVVVNGEEGETSTGAAGEAGCSQDPRRLAEPQGDTSMLTSSSFRDDTNAPHCPHPEKKVGGRGRGHRSIGT